MEGGDVSADFFSVKFRSHIENPVSYYRLPRASSKRDFINKPYEELRNIRIY
jgi:hypothetical protein